jgi:hypothetical protein
MLKVVRWDDNEAITHDPLRMTVEDVIDLDEGHLW